MKKFELPLDLKKSKSKHYTIVVDAIDDNNDNFALQSLYRTNVTNDISFMNIHFEVEDGELTKFYVEVN